MGGSGEVVVEKGWMRMDDGGVMDADRQEFGRMLVHKMGASMASRPSDLQIGRIKSGR
jgi:hypothetical protein